MQDVKTVGILSRPNIESAPEVLGKLIPWLEARGIEAGWIWFRLPI